MSVRFLRFFAGVPVCRFIRRMYLVIYANTAVVCNMLINFISRGTHVTWRRNLAKKRFIRRCIIIVYSGSKDIIWTCSCAGRCSIPSAQVWPNNTSIVAVTTFFPGSILKKVIQKLVQCVRRRKTQGPTSGVVNNRPIWSCVCSPFFHCQNNAL